MNIKILEKLNNKKVFVTGHTGFKGAYLCILLKYLGAKVYGYALKEEKDSLYDILNISKMIDGEDINDIRDYDSLKSYIKNVNPDYIIHMAAQPLVLKGYEEPRLTYETNVMGTINLMEAVRELDSTNLKSIVNVTTDKVYLNEDKDIAFSEDMKLCGLDPYANSKSCSDIITYSYKKSFFDNKNFRLNICRAGNVIGGGDICKDRIIPDIYRGILNHKKAYIRNEMSTRPYQYVLEPLILYLYIMLMSEENKKYEGEYNIGPDKEDVINNKKLVEIFYDKWGDDVKNLKEADENKNKSDTPHESKYLRLDNQKLKDNFQYKPLYNIEKAIENTVEVYKAIYNKKDIIDIIKRHISEVIK